MTENEAKIFIQNAMEQSRNVLAELMLIMPKVFAAKRKSLGEYYSNLENCKKEIQSCEVAIKALEDVQQYRALEKRLTDMFGGELSLEDVTDELERYLKEPDNPHPINAKILTYKEAADWYAYRAIGTPEEFLKMMTDRGFSKENLAQINCNLMLLKEYTEIGTPEECRAAMEKQTAKKIVRREATDEDIENELREFITRKGMIFQCPTCGCYIAVGGMKNCWDCGQKLDWSDEQ